MSHSAEISTPNWAAWTLVIIIGLGVMRLGLMILSPLNLHGDEAQYWAWAQALDWGYFTKPPMIAWVIAATTFIFGDAEWAVRLSSPLLHSVTAYLIFRTARFSFDAKTGFWAALIYLLMPAVWLSSGIVSTDVPLLLCWIIALNAWLHLRERPHWGYALQLGIALGLGILSKYAMLFFFPALGLAILMDPPSRKSLMSKYGFIAALLTSLIITPNILWNLQNDFATVTHTVANANLKGVPFHPRELAEFILSQLPVFGPPSFILLIGAIWASFKGRLHSPAIWLAAFTLSPLLIICLEALLARANANWAVTAYITGSILAAHMLVTFWPQWGRRFMIGLSLITLFCMSLISAVLIPGLGDQIGLSNSLKRLRGWPATVELIKAQYEQGHNDLAFSHIAVDNRRVFFDLNYYGIPHDGSAGTPPLHMWMHHAAPQNHAELNHPLPDGAAGPVLVIAYFKNYTPKLREDFDYLEPLPPITLELGGGKVRRYNAWAGYGYKRTTGR